MTYQDLLNKFNADFGLTCSVEKEKSGLLMLREGGVIGGPDCGHSTPARNNYASTPAGWAYILEGGEWKRLRDGCVDWRRGEECGFGKTLPDATIGPWD